MTWRALVAAGTFLCLLSLGLWLGRSPPEPVESRSVPSEDQPAPLTAPSPPLSRGDLVDSAARAADAVARGVPTPPDLRELSGRRFELKIPFGCGGETATDTGFDWSYDSEEQILRVTISPQVWTQTESLRVLAASKPFEAAEGFWIRRPWLRIGDCPPPGPSEAPAEHPIDPTKGMPPQSPKVSPVTETLALAELFEPGSRRAARRNGRPYELVARVAPGEIDLPSGFRLIVGGRLQPLSEGGPMACRVLDIYRPPLCFIAAQFDRVAITDGSGRRILAEWSN